MGLDFKRNSNGKQGTEVIAVAEVHGRPRDLTFGPASEMHGDP